MKNKTAIVSLAALATLVFLALPAAAQNIENPAKAAASPVGEEVSQAMEAEELSIYGEVQSVNAVGAGSLVVQYYDYDADDEKTITITLDADTKLENAGSIADIKKGDWADVTYSTAGDKNTAMSIIVEKEEETAAPAAAEQSVAMGEVMASGDEAY